MIERLFALGILLFVGQFTAFSQNALRIGDWRSHQSIRKANYVAQSDTEVFYSTEGTLVVVDKIDRSASFYTKLNKLNDVGLTLLKYQPNTETIIVCYDNSNIDLVGPSETINIPFIKNYDQPGDKFIYDVYVDGDEVYFACGFGLVKLNAPDAEVDFTTFTPSDMVVNTFARLDDQLYMGTSEGYFSVPVDNINIADFNQWTKLGAADGFADLQDARILTNYQGQLVVERLDSLFLFDGTNLSFLYAQPNSSIRFTTAEGPNLIIGLSSSDMGEQVLKYADGSAAPFSFSCANAPVFAIEDSEERVWFADDWYDFRVGTEPSQPCDHFTYNSPWVNFVNALEVAGDDVWTAAGGINPNQTYLWRPWGFQGREEGDWTIYNTFYNPELKDLTDFYDIVVQPDSGIVYTSSFLDGLIRYDGSQITVFNNKNSSLTNAIGDTSRTRVGGLTFDEEGNLWICNHNAQQPISVLKPDGTWKAFSVGTTSKRYLKVAVDQSGNKWFLLGSSSTEPIYVLDTGEDIDDESDDQWRVINSSNSELPNGNVRSIAVDLDGDVWVGTTEGAVVFECGANVFDDNCRGTRRIVQQDGINAFLLETETINAIAVDGANRKWFGTNNGIFVQSPNGEEQEAQFDDENSPLFDRVINDIAINGETGEVFIGTGRGLISFMAEATTGGQINQEALEIFPNPVRPNYFGPIAIKGLARDADVKITDISGRLVYEAQATGGQLVWDGRDYNGRRAASGVYLVLSTNVRRLLDPDAVLGKIVILNNE